MSYLLLVKGIHPTEVATAMLDGCRSNLKLKIRKIKITGYDRHIYQLLTLVGFILELPSPGRFSWRVLCKVYRPYPFLRHLLTFTLLFNNCKHFQPFHHSGYSNFLVLKIVGRRFPGTIPELCFLKQGTVALVVSLWPLGFLGLTSNLEFWGFGNSCVFNSAQPILLRSVPHETQLYSFNISFLNTHTKWWQESDTQT